MPTIDLNEKIKDDLKKIKEYYGCKTYSEAVAILTRSKKLEDNINWFFGRIINEITKLGSSLDEIRSALYKKGFEITPSPTWM